jgi:hypothetical protein
VLISSNENHEMSIIYINSTSVPVDKTEHLEQGGRGRIGTSLFWSTINEIYLQIFYTNEYNFADESIESNQFMIYYTNHLLIMKLNVSCSSHKLTQDCVGSFVTVFI